MHVWLIHPGELLPIDGDVRLYRYGILADMLARCGHSVTRWAPTFVHATKSYRCHQDKTVWLNPDYCVELLHAPGYRRHIGWKRYRFHKMVAGRFAERAGDQPPPDIIVCGMPDTELCLAATRYGHARGVPVILDVRDLWPDAAFDFLPAWCRPAVRWLLGPQIAKNRLAFRRADGVIGISAGFRDWGLTHAGRAAGPNDRVFYMGYPQATFSAEDRHAALGRWANWNVRPDGTFRCCFLAAIGSLYDLETMIAAARELQARGVTGVQFVLCGDGPKLQRLRSLAKGLPNVVIPGWVKAVDVQVLLEMSDLGAIPYRGAVRTALPNKAVSYFSAGLPVLSTAGGEFASILQSRNCGLTYLPGSARDFLRTFELLRGEPALRAELSTQARRFYDEELDSERVYSRMIDFLANVSRQSIRQAA
jgi:glycosyltransferase involved in cell wall biosynthesis